MNRAKSRHEMVLQRGFGALALEVIIAGLVVLSSLHGLEDKQAALDREALKYAAAIAVDEARWEHDPLLAAHDGGDAAQILLAHLVGDVPTALAASIVDAGEGWPAISTDVRAIDLRWMRELESFGFWDVVDARGDGGFDSNIADRLRVLAKVRLLQGLQANELRAALVDVRELARLAVSTENNLVVATGAGLLAHEARSLDAAAERGEAPQPDDAATDVSNRWSLYGARYRRAKRVGDSEVREFLARSPLRSAWCATRKFELSTVLAASRVEGTRRSTPSDGQVAQRRMG